MKRIYFAECDDCGWTWESERRYESCQNCGLTNITVWETQEQLERKKPGRYPWGSGGNRRLSDIK